MTARLTVKGGKYDFREEDDDHFEIAGGYTCINCGEYRKAYALIDDDGRNFTNASIFPRRELEIFQKAHFVCGNCVTDFEISDLSDLHGPIAVATRLDRIYYVCECTSVGCTQCTSLLSITPDPLCQKLLHKIHES